jgi:ABC-type branched-subunit amino acid transport system ATPase component
MRLEFSLATTIHPDILILDEVFAAGDIRFVEKARLRMHDIVDKANILLVVSHDMKLISELANRVIWIESGRVHKSGEPKLVIDAFAKFMSNGNL